MDVDSYERFRINDFDDKFTKNILQQNKTACSVFGRHFYAW